MPVLSSQTRRRFAVLLRRKSAIAAFVVVVLLNLAGLGSEWITNSKPIVGSIHGRLVFPAYVDYNREVMGLEGAGTVDYRELKSQFSWAVWPLLNWDPYENDNDLDVIISGPSTRHPMGTDVAGRDVFARLLYGTRISFIFGIAVWIFSDLAGTILGLIQGYAGGKVDLFGQRLVEVFQSIPPFYLLLFLITVITPTIPMLIALLVLFGWVGTGQYLRGEALRNKELTFCESARSLGATPARVLFRHILPNSLVPLITFAPFNIIGGILALSSLDLLGFGAPAPTPSWGELLDQARKNFQVAWWLAVFPSLFLFVSIVSLNLIGEALRAAFDPRAKL